jgi:hypothetical protein
MPVKCNSDDDDDDEDEEEEEEDDEEEDEEEDAVGGDELLVVRPRPGYGDDLDDSCPMLCEREQNEKLAGVNFDGSSRLFRTGFVA